MDPIQADKDHVGKRARLVAHLGKARIAVQIDIGTGDAVGAQHEEIEIPLLLDGLPAPQLKAYPRQASVAEKFEAMVNLDIRNSRMKDFHDVWALSRSFSFDGPSLRRAVTSCFDRRKTPLITEMPRALTPAFYERSEIAQRWRAYRTAGAVLVAPPESFAEIGVGIIRFLGPLRDAITREDAVARSWPIGGPWQQR